MEYSKAAGVSSKKSEHSLALSRRWTTLIFAFRRYRSFKSERHTVPPAGFVDGNFVDRFAELSPENVERVMQGRNEYERLSATKEEVLRVVEEMARMH